MARLREIRVEREAERFPLRPARRCRRASARLPTSARRGRESCTRPGRSVANSRPSGAKARDQGMSRLLATTSTRKRTPSWVVNTPAAGDGAGAGGAGAGVAGGSFPSEQPPVLVCAMSSAMATTAGPLHMSGSYFHEPRSHGDTEKEDPVCLRVSESPWPVGASRSRRRRGGGLRLPFGHVHPAQH